jgi:hypothetical protein
MIRCLFRPYIFLLILLAVRPAHAQSPGTIFPGLTGPQLHDSLYQRYKPAAVLPYNIARDTLFARVMAVDDDTLRCIYTGHALYLDPTQDPTQYVYLNGMANGMNTEHAYPQSKGAADGNARSDMHHLFPTRNAVNSARGNSPYAEIPDAETVQWYYRTQSMTAIPTVNKDQYSESTGEEFEPREDAKGNVARAVFYFYTMYKSQAFAADPLFFDLQRATLCQWHLQDPSDETEKLRTWRIAQYQDGKPNPFVLDCTLARRTFCPELLAACLDTPVTEPGREQLPAAILPNPFSDHAKVELVLPFGGNLRIRLLSLLGQEIAVFQAPQVPAGPYSYNLRVDGLPLPSSWLGLLQIQLEGTQGRATTTLRIMSSGF